MIKETFEEGEEEEGEEEGRRRRRRRKRGRRRRRRRSRSRENYIALLLPTVHEFLPSNWIQFWVKMYIHVHIWTGSSMSVVVLAVSSRIEIGGG